MEECGVDDKEVEFPLCEEYDYPSLCVVEDTNHLVNEYSLDEIIGPFSKDLQMTSDHLLKDEPFGKLNSSDLVVDNNGNLDSDQDGIFGYSMIETF